MGPIKCCTVLALVASTTCFGQTKDENSFLRSGVFAYQAGEFSIATEHFTRLIGYEPTSATAFLYLGTAYAADYYPGAVFPENLAKARNAETAFRKALELSPDSKLGLASLGMLLYYEGWRDGSEAGARKVAEAKLQLKRLATIDSQSEFAVYSLGAIDAMSAFIPIAYARTKMGMKAGAPGPLRDAAVRQQLRDRFGGILDGAIQYMMRALEIAPDSLDALANVKECWRAKADLAGSSGESAEASSKAREFERKSTAIRKEIDDGRRQYRAEPLWGLEIIPILSAPQPTLPPPPPAPPKN